GVVITSNYLTNQGLREDVPNLARSLSNAGYRTAAVGKWNLTRLSTPLETHALRLGFGFFAGLLGQPGDAWVVSTRDSFNYFRYEWCTSSGCSAFDSSYLTTKETTEAIAQLSGSTPFFLYVAYNAPHTPFHCPPSSLHSYGPTCSPGDSATYYKAML